YPACCRRFLQPFQGLDWAAFCPYPDERHYPKIMLCDWVSHLCSFQKPPASLGKVLLNHFALLESQSDTDLRCVVTVMSLLQQFGPFLSGQWHNVNLASQCGMDQEKRELDANTTPTRLFHSTPRWRTEDNVTMRCLHDDIHQLLPGDGVHQPCAAFCGYGCAPYSPQGLGARQFLCL